MYFYESLIRISISDFSQKSEVTASLHMYFLHERDKNSWLATVLCNWDTN